MAGETETPNIGLQIPAYNQPNWQVPTNFNWNRLDLMLGGVIPMPALADFVITNIGAQIAAATVTEAPAGVVPGNSYVLSHVPAIVLGFYWNGIFQRPGIDYTLLGSTITMITGATAAGDVVYAVYLKVG